MGKVSEFDNILDECLERVLGGNETIEQCLEAYPAHAAELEPLLHAALDFSKAVAVKPSTEFREMAARQFQVALREMELKENRGFFSWQPRWAMALAGVVVILLAGTGTVAAAAGSLPDEPLYQVKLATEAVRLTLTPSEIGKAELYVELADERVSEIIEMAEEGKIDYVESTTVRLDGQLVAMASNLAEPAGEGAAEAPMPMFEAAPRAMTAEETPAAAPEPQRGPVAPPIEPAPTTTTTPEHDDVQMEVTAPDTVVPEIAVPPDKIAAPEPEPETAPAIELQPAPMPVPAPTPAPKPIPAPTIPSAEEAAPAPEQASEVVPPVEQPLTAAAPGGAGENVIAEQAGEGAELDEQEALRLIISRRAVENTAALQEILDSVPESSRPALLRALEVATAGYERALSNLR